jgi:multiple sugar transport system ATP-binding protein
VSEIVLNRVVKRFGPVEVVHGVDLAIADREFVILVGPSGCGKSTLLRMIAGLEEITAGDITIGGTVINEIEPRDRGIAMVFQDYALYPHMSVFENMSFGLRMRKAPTSEIDERVREAARVLQIEDYLDRRPGQLSGGQRQRVAMGRAIVRKPNAFLFDEPLSNLDAKLRVDMRTEIKRLHRTLQTTMVYVTHDQVEAMTLADRMVVLRDGYIEQVGEPEDIYTNPNNTFVAGFIGAPTMNFIPCRLSTADGGEPAIQMDDGDLYPLPAPLKDAASKFVGAALIAGIRPEHMRARTDEVSGTPWIYEGAVNVVEPLGSDTLAHLPFGGIEITARVEPGKVRAAGQPIRLVIDPVHVHLFDAETGNRLIPE